MDDKLNINRKVSNLGSRSSSIKLREEITKLMILFRDAGASELALSSLLDSNVLIDLYGEDIRNRAYTTIDPLGEKKILRPDFTVPIVQMHILSENKYGKYSYSGPVWRSQSYDSRKPSEYYQAGFEYFHEIEASRADAEVFDLFQRCTIGLELDIELGDMGILRAIVNCLDISDNKRRLLLRHLWRPDRFRQLLKQLSNGHSTTDTRTALFRAIKSEKFNEYVQENGPIIGRRSLKEIDLRSNELLKEESKKPISRAALMMIEKIQRLKCSLSSAPNRIIEFLSLGNELEDVCDNLSNRIQVMTEIGIDVDKLSFATNLSQTSLEYYDGFIFSMSVKGFPDIPPVSQGGRYNELTSILTKGASVPAVGGIIRPEILSSLR